MDYKIPTAFYLNVGFILNQSLDRYQTLEWALAKMIDKISSILGMRPFAR